jgi:hypothetical protein
MTCFSCAAAPNGSNNYLKMEATASFHWAFSSS